MGDIYQDLVADFNDQTGLTDFEQERYKEFVDRYDVLDEEVLELEDEIINYRDRFRGSQTQPTMDREDRVMREARIVEELADVLVTAFSLADVMGLDITTAFAKKMDYNLFKTGGTIVEGKVVDDVEAPKPDFVDCVPFNDDEFEDKEIIDDEVGVWE